MGMDFSILQAVLIFPVHCPGNIRDRSKLRWFSGNFGAPKDSLV